MTKIEEIKEGIASKEGYGCWKDDMLAGAKELATLEYLDSLVTECMRAAVNQALEDAADKATVRNAGSFYNPYKSEVDRYSILSVKQQYNP